MGSGQDSEMQAGTTNLSKARKHGRLFQYSNL